MSARLAVEAGVSVGWSKYTGTGGATVGRKRFGASAPGDVALKNLGFNTENVVRQARSLLGRSGDESQTRV